MAVAARAIIIEDNKMLLMRRKKQGVEYFTLIGGRLNDGESIEQGLMREVKEETGLDVVWQQLVFVEHHPAPYNDQYIYLVRVASTENAAVQDYSEEGQMNKRQVNIHELVWVETKAFHNLHFRTPQLYHAIIDALKRGFPHSPVKL